MSSMKIILFSVLAAFIGAASALAMRGLLAAPAPYYFYKDGKLGLPGCR